MTGQQLWEAFVKENGPVDRIFDEWSFGVEPDKLAELVLDGEKTATASAYPLYELEQVPLPETGEYSVILDADGEAVCVIRTTKVTVVPFCEVTEEHAYKEGEGDRSLEFWRNVHEAFFRECMAEAGLEFTPSMKVVCEEFEVVYTKNMVAPEWKVYFDGGFYDHRGRDRQGKELKIDKRFRWYDEQWYIPSVYICARGLVMDVFAEVEPSQLDAFIEKWHAYVIDGEEPTERQREQIDFENPINVEFQADVFVNQKRIAPKGSYGMSWIPNHPEGTSNNWEAGWVLGHYGLDKRRAWIIRRFRYLWKGRKKPEISQLECFLHGDAYSFSTKPFTLSKAGDSADVENPFTKERYTVTAVEVRNEQLNADIFGSDKEYPTHITNLSYRVTPDIADGKMYLQDSEDGDHPRASAHMPERDSDAAIAIIGGADGPTVMVVGRRQSADTVHNAVSSVRFAPKDTVKWKAVFSEVVREEIRVELLEIPV